ncbi:MAG: DUF11 domain-containing protein, partial [Sphingomonadaceae bacterium]|nr:DUF11 domain-containing protein [Sphingomonadaceae bacterium]
APAVQAQTYQYTNSTDGSVNESVTPCTNTFKRTFTVSQNFTVTDVNIGVLAAHTYRGDLVMWLKGPDGTRVQLTPGSGSNGAANFNVLFDDSAGSSIVNYTNSVSVTSTTPVPPYGANYQPSSALSAFIGKNSVGTWTLEICDQFGGDSGTFYQADLYLTAGTVSSADLSLGVTVNDSTPLPGVATIYTMTVTNNASSTSTANSITVNSSLPAFMVYRSASGTGSYNSGTGVWSVGSLAPGASASISIYAANSSTAGTSGTFSAEISGSSTVDPDSTPNNGSTTEDDDDRVTTVTATLPAAGTPPAFTCGGTTTTFDWDSQGWTTGSLSGSFSVGGVATNLNITGNTGSLIADPSTGSQTPVRNTSSPGGFTGQNSLMLALDAVTSSESVTATWTFTGGLGGLQFRVADIDLFYDQFNDRVTVTGSYQGISVTPILTAGRANSVTGNAAVATALADNTTADGNLIVTFDQPVDTVSVTYGPDPATSPAAPGIQAISLLDMTMCVGITQREWSDAPTSGTSYGTASHDPSSGIRMGASIDFENAALPGTGATGDDADASDDEDGVTLPSFQKGTIADIPVSVTGSGFLQAWIDWNGNGSFADSGEQIAANIQDGGIKDFDGAANGQILLKAVVPAAATSSTTYARFRWSSVSGLGSTGNAANGEVEDYALTIAADGSSPVLRGCGGTSVTTHTMLSSPTNGTVATGSATGTFATTIVRNGFTIPTATVGSSGVEYGMGNPFNGAPDSFEYDYAVAPDTNMAVKQIVVCQSSYENSTGNNEPNELTLTWPGGTSAVIYDPNNQITSHANGAVITSGTTLYFADSVPNGTGTGGNGLSGPDSWAIIVDAANATSTFTVTAQSSGCDLSDNTNFCHLMSTSSNTTGERFNEWITFDTELVGVATTLTVVKSSFVVSDFISASDPKAIPGATVRYCILVSNTGPVAAENIVLNDTVPTDVTYIAGSMKSGSGCGTATTAEDDDAAGADESDPIGASFNAGALQATASSLASGSTMAVIFDAIVK